jgi:Family of unknown function (DUF6074)
MNALGNGPSRKPVPPPMAEVIPFPAAHRRGEIRKLAARMMNFSAERAESHLRYQMWIKAETMRRRGVAEDEIARTGPQ